MDQPAQINTESTQLAVSPGAPLPVPPPKSNKILLIFLVILGLILAGGLVYAGVQIRKKQSQTFVLPTPVPTEIVIPTTIPSPTKTIIPTTYLSTPTPDPTAGWRTYTNDFARFTLKYPKSFTFTEKSFSDKEKQVIFKGEEGKLTINMATSDYSPGWGGGCDQKDKKKITFLGNQVEVCLNDTGMHELYTSHLSGKWQLNISATFLGDPVKARELFDQILATFKFLE